MKRQRRTTRPAKGLRKASRTPLQAWTAARHPHSLLIALQKPQNGHCLRSRRRSAPGSKHGEGSTRARTPRKRSVKPPWRPQRYGERVLVFDTETTTDAAQRLLFGFFRLYERDRLILEGLIVADILDYEQMTTLTEYAARCRLADLQPRAVRGRGLLSRGLRRRHAVRRLQPAVRPRAHRRARGICRGENRRKFRLVPLAASALARSAHRIALARAALSRSRPSASCGMGAAVLCRALLRSQRGSAAHSPASATACAARVSISHVHAQDASAGARRDRPARLLYGRQDVRATWALYKALRAEYARHPFATFENELHKPKNGRYMGELYSSASIAKQYLRLLGIVPLLEKQPRFPRKYLGIAAAAYFGGRADVRVRKCRRAGARAGFHVDVPHDLLPAGRSRSCSLRRGSVRRSSRPRSGALAGQMASDNPLAVLYDPKTWRKLQLLRAG